MSDRYLLGAEAPAAAPAPASTNVLEIGDHDFQDLIPRSRELPILVVFYAPNSPECTDALAHLEAAAGGADGKWLLARIDISRHQAIASQLRLPTVPAVLAFKDGRPVDQLMGPFPPAELERLLARVVVSPAAPLLRQARALLDQGGAPRAEQVLRDAIARFGADDEINTLLARARADQGDTPGALAVLDQISSHKLSDEGRALLARLRFGGEEQDGPADLDALAAAVGASPDDLEARWTLAAALAGAGRFEEALEHYLELVRRDREFRDDGARKAMLDIFEVIGLRSPLAERYRKWLSWELY